MPLRNIVDANAPADIQLLRALADAMPQLIWSTRADGVHDYFNKPWYEYTGNTLAQAQSDAWSELVHPDDAARTRAHWDEALATGTPYEVEFRFKRASDGAYRWFLARANPVRDEQGTIVRWFGTCTDIDDQKRAAFALAEVSHRERAIAEALQGTVQPELPDGLPGLDLASFYKAALDEAGVGGDFSDVFALDKDCTALVVGDLSGKGLAAAAQVATVRNMLRYALYMGDTLAEAITHLNAVLVANTLLTGFLTLVVVTFELGLKTLTYVSCGQEPGLIRRTPDGHVDELPPTGPVLGMTDTARYQQRTLTLAAGDAFALYTDGLTEAGPDRRHMLGVDGLTEFIKPPAGSAQEIVSRIISGVDAYTGGVFRDDVCLLVGVVQNGGPC